MLCKQNSPINFFIIEIDSGQVCLIRSMSLYVKRKGDTLLRLNLSKVDGRECILLGVADKNCGRMSPLRKTQLQLASYTSQHIAGIVASYLGYLPMQLKRVLYTQVASYLKTDTRLDTDSWSADGNDYVNSACTKKKKEKKTHLLGSFGNVYSVTDQNIFHWPHTELYQY